MGCNLFVGVFGVFGAIGFGFLGVGDVTSMIGVSCPVSGKLEADPTSGIYLSTWVAAQSVTAVIDQLNTDGFLSRSFPFLNLSEYLFISYSNAVMRVSFE